MRQRTVWYWHSTRWRIVSTNLFWQAAAGSFKTVSLSPHILHFTTNRVLWECHHSSVSETEPAACIYLGSSLRLEASSIICSRSRPVWTYYRGLWKTWRAGQTLRQIRGPTTSFTRPILTYMVVGWMWSKTLQSSRTNSSLLVAARRRCGPNRKVRICILMVSGLVRYPTSFSRLLVKRLPPISLCSTMRKGQKGTALPLYALRTLIQWSH